MPFILEKIPVGSELNYGFTNREEFKAIEVGDPFKYYSYNGSELEKSTTISVPVIAGHEFRALASLDYIKESLHIVDFGASGLAKEIQAVQKDNKNLSFIGLLRIYRVSSDFAFFSRNNESLFFPLTSAKNYLRFIGISKIEKYYSQSQIVDIINNIPNE